MVTRTLKLDSLNSIRITRSFNRVANRGIFRCRICFGVELSIDCSRPSSQFRTVVLSNVCYDVWRKHVVTISRAGKLRQGCLVDHINKDEY